MPCWKRTPSPGNATSPTWEEAADAPTLIPFTLHRHNAHWLCVFIETGWSAQYRVDTAALAATTSPLGVASPLAAAVTLVIGRTRLNEYPARKDRRHILRAVGDSGTNDEARSALVPRLLKFFELDDARLVLTDWVADAPTDPVPYRLGARLELEQGNPGEALRWTERGLTNCPGDQELEGQRAKVHEARKAVPPG